MGRSFLKGDGTKTKVILYVYKTLPTNILKEIHRIGFCGTVTLYSANSLLLLNLRTANHHLCASVSLESIIFFWFSNI